VTLVTFRWHLACGSCCQDRAEHRSYYFVVGQHRQFVVLQWRFDDPGNVVAVSPFEPSLDATNP